MCIQGSYIVHNLYADYMSFTTPKRSEFPNPILHILSLRFLVVQNSIGGLGGVTGQKVETTWE